MMEQLDHNLLFRWFVGLNPDDPVWVPTVFTKNHERLIRGNIADAFLQEVLKAASTHGLFSHEHLTVDGPPREAWASPKLLGRRTTRPAAVGLRPQEPER
ncbi:MAG: transposase [Gemmatimonadaceae bacterium]|nr:transposase [Gemmatimonadaceae bacterium]